MTDKPLADRLALVTGASRGIGAATAKALGAAGAHVVLTARTPGGLEETEDAIHRTGGSATIAPLDLTETDSVARLGAAIADRWQALDILVLNAAALGTLGTVGSFDAKEFSRVMTLNVSAQAALIGSFDQMLRNSVQGRVIGLTTTPAREPRAYWGMYGASKAAFENLLLSYGAEVRHISAVRTALLNPGATRTAMRQRAYPGEDPATVKPPEDVAERIVSLLTDDFETGHYERLD
ncbi:SDR family NAD(P)-dependent oxidoreductase [Stakelama saccharophila]|uniref:SDR family NAD(P)-dependent oxidoreductase n=1 Tax=Stakelama saccharophila TaxID=3075605 RepID=A0ABZ0B5Z5_9SPHN|nr:SDR family NAD(P)-dependent oxidoreductase [Stakelama sp. W311]WNO52821.1 SDR family NAD(P)-dependent oxidoreductase [Stakelama sp. W311]